MESYIFKSFVKGIMKTSGGLLVLGIGIFIYDNVNFNLGKGCGDNYKACSAEIEKINRLNEFIIKNKLSIGIDNTNGDITVLKTDKDDSGQLYVRGKACGKLNQEKKTEIHESEIEEDESKIEEDESETNYEESQDKDFKKLFTF